MTFIQDLLVFVLLIFPAGFLITRTFFWQDFPRGERAALTLLFSLGSAALYLFSFGSWIGLRHPGALLAVWLVLLGLGAGLAARHWKRRPERPRSPEELALASLPTATTPAGRLLTWLTAAATGLVLAPIFFHSLFYPTVAFDALMNYVLHARWILHENSFFTPLPTHPFHPHFWATPRIWMALFGTGGNTPPDEAWTHLLAPVFGLIMFYYTARFCRLTQGPWPVAVAGLLATPLVIAHIGAGQGELPVMALFTVSLYYFAQAGEGPATFPPRRLLLLAGYLGGCAAICKLQGAYLVIALGLLWVVFWIRRRPQHYPRPWQSLGALALGFLLGGGYWYLTLLLRSPFSIAEPFLSQSRNVHLHTVVGAGFVHWRQRPMLAVSYLLNSLPPILLALYGAGLVSAVLLLVRRGRLRRLGLICTVSLLFFICPFWLFFLAQIDDLVYFMPLLAVGLAAAAGGLWRWLARRGLLKRALVANLALLACAAAFVALFRGPLHQVARGAAQGVENVFGSTVYLNTLAPGAMFRAARSDRYPKIALYNGESYARLLQTLDRMPATTGTARLLTNDFHLLAAARRDFVPCDTSPYPNEKTVRDADFWIWDVGTLEDWNGINPAWEASPTYRLLTQPNNLCRLLASYGTYSLSQINPVRQVEYYGLEDLTDRFYHGAAEIKAPAALAQFMSEWNAPHRRILSGGVARKGFLQSPGTKISFTLPVRAEGGFLAGCAGKDDHSVPWSKGGARMSVQIDGREVAAMAARTEDGGAGGSWIPFQVDLAPYRGRTIQVTLAAEELPGGEAGWVGWGTPMFVKPEALKLGFFETPPFQGLRK